MDLEIIKEAMTAKEWGPKALSEASGVPKTTIERILRGDTPNPTFQNVADMAAALGVSLNDIAGIEYDLDDKKGAPVIHHTQSAEVKLLYNRMLSEKDRRIRALTVALSLLAGFQAFRWTFDISNPEMGWIRLEDANVNFIAVFMIVAFALGGLAVVLWLFRRKKDK